MKTEANFQLDFTLEGKAVSAVDDDGDTFIEGFAADFGMDRQDEAFEPGAFEQGVKSFMESNPVLLYHHKFDQALGQVIEFEHRDKGLWVKARVDKPAPGSWAEDVVNKIRKGTIRGFSVGGKFHRRMTPKGPRIHTADVAEISVTPLSIGRNTLFGVAGKAFGEDPALDELVARVSALTDTFEALEGKAAPTAEQRKKYGMSGGEFPIWHCGDGPGGVGAAKSDIGRTKLDKSAVQAHIARRAKALGCPDKAKTQSD